MLEVEALTIADAYEWLGTGIAASEYLDCHQTTVSRTVQQIRNTQAKLVAIGAQELLEAERKIHQILRFRQGKDLRLHLYQWTNQLIRRNVPSNWAPNPLRTSATKVPGICLLENRFIDAICAPYPLIANANQSIFTIIPLYASFLQLLSNKNAPIAKEKNLSEADIACMTKLGKLDFVPSEASTCSEIMDAEIFNTNHPADKTIEPERRYWGTPLTSVVLKALQPISYKQICPYAEYLVVLKEWENHPMVNKLQESITREIGLAISGNPASELIKIEK